MPLALNNRIHPQEAPDQVEFIPTEGQKKIFRSKNRFIFAMSGQRGGKTTTGAYWAGLNSQIPGTTGLITANTIDQLNQSTLSKFWEVFPQYKKYYVVRDRTVYLPNGVKIYTRSMDNPDLLKGLNLNWIWVDEGDGMSRYGWDVLRSRVATTLGKILVTSSIYIAGWVFDEIYNKKQKDYEIITWPSIENPSFPQEEWDQLRATTDPIHFAREYEAKFVFDTGKVYAGIKLYGFLKENAYPNGSKPVRILFGIDFGVNDPTAISVVTLNDDGCWYIIDETYQSSLSIQEINRVLEGYIEKYGTPMLTLIDSAGGVARLSIIPRANPMDAQKDLHGGITLVRDLIYQKKVYVFPRCVNTRREFELYQYDAKRRSEPEDRNNHIMDEIRYIIYTTYEWLKAVGKKEEEKEELPSFWQRKYARGMPDKLSSDDRFNESFSNEGIE
jgi:phage terminase large subunit